MILGHGIKGQVQLWHSACKTLRAQYKLVSAQSPSYMTCKLLIMRGETLLILSHWVKFQG